jgi:nucleotide-binding universal stress UspA family protein
VVVTGHSNTPEGRREVAPKVQVWYEQVVLADVRPKHNVKVQTPVGVAHAELLRAVNEAGADLIVIGATGRRGSFGKTIRHVLRDSGCEVMTVPAPRQSDR